MTTKWENDAHNMSSKFKVRLCPDFSSHALHEPPGRELENMSCLHVCFFLVLCLLLLAGCICYRLVHAPSNLQVPRAPSLIQLRPHWNLKKHLPSMSGYGPWLLSVYAHCHLTAGNLAWCVMLVPGTNITHVEMRDSSLQVLPLP